MSRCTFSQDGVLSIITHSAKSDTGQDCTEAETIWAYRGLTPAVDADVPEEAMPLGTQLAVRQITTRVVLMNAASKLQPTAYFALSPRTGPCVGAWSAPAGKKL
ncbi:hypothetical protein AC579_4616 [Pseudocercospora musae]|uniref:Uncharacterized protein n=1 Tax=Pseudocercospora musae TaxID=113226 RepID=A0A139H257_9PEZI|nr:hypothetical protein AC579_4616 [Pseudocercospora musae]